MKKYHFLLLAFAFAVLFFVYGTFAHREAMRWSALGLTLVVLGTTAISWKWTRADFVSERTQQINAAYAASNTFLFLVLLLAVVFLWDIFVHSIVNPDFAVFGALFLSIMIMRLSIIQTLGEYVGRLP